MSIVLPPKDGGIYNPFAMPCECCGESAMELMECGDCHKKVGKCCETDSDPNMYLCYRCLERRERDTLRKG